MGSETCTHLTTSYIIVKAQLRSHQMLKVEPHKAFRHHAVKLTVKCQECSKEMPKTFDFSGEGKFSRFGHYVDYMEEIRRKDVSLSYASVDDIFKNMPVKAYCAVTNNCQHWSDEFFKRNAHRHDEFSKAPERSLDDMKTVFYRSLHKNFDDVFDEFDSRPCGAASLAQVHRAKLKSSDEYVAVKIQHLHVKDRSFVDMATMEFFVNVASFVFPELKLKWLVRETKLNLPQELDFLREAANADKVRRMFSHMRFVKIPKIHYNYSSDKVLTMEFCEGGQIDDLDYFQVHQLDRHKICRLLGALYSEMIFRRGYVHSDPHPGNVLVRRSANTGREEIVLLDHGLYCTLPDELRIDYAKLWLALMKPDQDEIRRVCERMNIGQNYGLFACIVTMRSWKSVTAGIARTEIDDRERSHIKEYATGLIPQISVVLDSIPRQMLLILKTNDLLRSIAFKLKTEHRLDSFSEMTKHCTRAVYHHSIAATQSLLSKLRLYLAMYVLLVKINIFEVFLIVNGLLTARQRHLTL